MQFINTNTMLEYVQYYNDPFVIGIKVHKQSFLSVHSIHYSQGEYAYVFPPLATYNISLILCKETEI